MPRSSEQFDVIRNRKKQLILDTALKLFAENGFHATSISRIAKKAGISKGLTYNYFSSKQEILDEIIQNGFDSIYTHFDLNHDGVLTEDEFIYFIQKAIHVIVEKREFWKLYMSLMLQSDLAQTVRESYSLTSTKILSMLTQFIASRGSKNPEKDLQSIAFLLKGATLIAITNPEVFESKNTVETITESCFRLITK